MSTSMQDRIEAERQRARPALSASPVHRFKQPGGARYPQARPDGLVYQKQLRLILGIAETTLLRWQRNGWIAPEGKDGHCTLYRVPTPERILEIRTLMAERAVQGAARGRQTQHAQGAHLDRAAVGRASKTKQAQARAAEGLLNKRGLAELLGAHCQSLNEWIEAGIIVPARVSETGKWMWFTRPDEATMERLRSVAKGRTKSRLCGIKPEEPREKRAYNKNGARSTVNIVSQAQAKLKRGTHPAGTISFDEAAERAGVSKDSIIHWTEKGWLACVREGRYCRGIVPSVLDVWLAERVHQKALHGKRNAGNVASPRALQKRELGRVVKLEASRPEGGLTRAEAAAELGLNRRAFDKHVQRGNIAAIEGGWILRSELERYRADLASSKAALARPKVREVPKPALKIIAPQPAPTKAPVKPLVVVEGFVAYETAIQAGRTNPCFQNALGFNLLAHPSLGFRPAAVNEKPEGGWRYHERHAINGFGQWQVKAQKPITGEILL